MPDSPSLKIFLPVLLVVAVTFIGFIKMAIERVKAVKGGQNPDSCKVYLGDPEPENTRAAVRHWNNMFKLPTVFCTGCPPAATSTKSHPRTSTTRSSSADARQTEP